jgi:hypothetical protein
MSIKSRKIALEQSVNQTRRFEDWGAAELAALSVRIQHCYSGTKRFQSRGRFG